MVPIKILSRGNATRKKQMFSMTEIIENLLSIFRSSVESVQPLNLIKSTIKLSESGCHLQVKEKSYALQKPCYLVGFGKAVYGMAVELENILGARLQRGVVTVPVGLFKYLNPSKKSKIEFIEGASHNIPDKAALDGALKIRDLVKNLQADDLLFVLISGGGSALLPLPIHPITLEEKQSLIRNLSNRGADIMEVNSVRKRISTLKGGGLAKLAYPARVISLVLSDVIGDPLGYIASGPTTPYTDSQEKPLEIIQRYSLQDRISHAVRDVLEKDQKCSSEEIQVINGEYIHVDNFIIGNNRITASRAMEAAEVLGFQSVVMSTQISGDVDKLARMYSNLAYNIDLLVNGSSTKAIFKTFLESLKEDLHLLDSAIDEIAELDFTKKVCLIGGGEPTVRVRGTGKGGRNQHLALAYSVEVNKREIQSAVISLLSGGTDGMDGPTDAAGAIGTSDLVQKAREESLEAQKYLENNDSYNFFTKYSSGENLIKIGHTGTNVMDIHILTAIPK